MITENFEEWLVSQKIKKSYFEKMIWEMKWGVCQYAPIQISLVGELIKSGMNAYSTHTL